MNLPSILLWGFMATLVLTSLMSAAQGLGVTRISIPYLVGTMISPERRVAWLAGTAVHFMNGWIFAIVYALVFESLGAAGWWRGTLLGTLQGLAVLMVLMPLMPHMHPRMADDRQGPVPTWSLEPPGFMALHYGRRTPIVTTLAHSLYGLVLGLFYQLAP